jgi:hypothetical protein
MTVKPGDVHIVQGTDDWSALYVDGKLEAVGDHYVIQEKLLDLLEISWEQSNDFLQGGNYRQDVAETYDELLTYRAQRQNREARASALREKAQELIRQAAALEDG